MPLHTDKLIQKEINKHNYMNNRTLLFVVAASLGCVNAVAGNVYDGTNDDKDISKSIDLNPVVVTGNGHHQLLKSTTTPVHVLSQQAINPNRSLEKASCHFLMTAIRKTALYMLDS